MFARLTDASTRSGSIASREVPSLLLAIRKIPPEPIDAPADIVSIETLAPPESRVMIQPLSERVPEEVFVSSIHSSAPERSLPLQRSSEKTIVAPADANGARRRRAPRRRVARSRSMEYQCIPFAEGSESLPEAISFSRLHPTFPCILRSLFIPVTFSQSSFYTSDFLSSSEYFESEVINGSMSGRFFLFE